MELDNEKLIEMLRQMVLMRELEDRLEQKLFRQGKIPGGVYVATGQEAIPVGVVLSLNNDDVLCPTHRDIGAFLMKGFTPGDIIANYMGRIGGPTKGRDQSLHMGDLKRNVVAFVSHLADNVPVAVGIALAFKMKKEPRISVAISGEGATSRGDWHEGLNLASVWKLPMIFVINNNAYAYSTPASKQYSVKDIADRAVAYNMPGKVVDGNDVVAIYEASCEAVQRARNAEGPTIIECKTFRMSGHAAHDNFKYVPKELLEEWERKDPIKRHSNMLLKSGAITPKDFEDIRAWAKAEVDRGVEFAENSPFPEQDEFLTGVYAEPKTPASPALEDPGLRIIEGGRKWQ